MAVVDFLHLRSSLSLRSFARLGSGVAMSGVRRFGSSTSVLHFVRFGSSLSLRSFSRFGLSVSVLDFVYLGSSLWFTKLLSARFLYGRYRFHSLGELVVLVELRSLGVIHARRCGALC